MTVYRAVTTPVINMAVYVDNLVNNGWHLGANCHLIADTREELHAFALSIGMKRVWYQPGSFPHYDLTASRRAAAVRLGAVPLDRKAYVYKMWELRDTDEYADVPGMSVKRNATYAAQKDEADAAPDMTQLLERVKR